MNMKIKKLSRGLLTGELTGNFPPGDFRSYAPRFTGENFEQNRKKVDQLKQIAKSKNCTPSQLAIAWVLHKGDDILPLIGTSKRKTLAENMEALKIDLSKEEMEELDSTFPEGAFAGTRYPQQQMGIVVR